MKLIIPMSGQGKRFVEKGYTDPKPLIKVDDGKPIIQRIIELFPGITDIHCICREQHLQETNMRKILTDLGATIHTIEGHSLGPVYAVAHIFHTIADDEEVIVSYCDYGTVWDFEAFKSMIATGAYDGVIAAYKGFHPHMLWKDNYAFLRMTDQTTVAEVREKEPFTDDRMAEYASNGTYYFRRGADLKKYFFATMDKGFSKNGEFYVSLVYNLMIADKLRIGVFEIEKMLQWGTPRDYEEYMAWSRHFKRQRQTCNSVATLILPMAGRGSRFQMVGYNDPKPLLKVRNEPMIVQAVNSLPDCTNKTFICLKEHLDKYPLVQTLKEKFPNCKIIDIPDVTEGQACTSNIGIEDLDDNTPILISACDNGVDFDADAYKRLEEDPTIDVIVWSFDNNPTSQLYPHMYAWLDTDPDLKIRRVSVKKHFPGARHAIIGTMFFRSAKIFREGYAKILATNTRTNGEFYVDDLLNPLIDANYNVRAFPVISYLCWGTPNDYKTYNYWNEYFSGV